MKASSSFFTVDRLQAAAIEKSIRDFGPEIARSFGERLSESKPSINDTTKWPVHSARFSDLIVITPV